MAVQMQQRADQAAEELAEVVATMEAKAAATLEEAVAVKEAEHMLVVRRKEKYLRIWRIVGRQFFRFQAEGFCEQVLNLRFSRVFHPFQLYSSKHVGV